MIGWQSLSARRRRAPADDCRPLTVTLWGLVTSLFFLGGVYCHCVSWAPGSGFSPGCQSPQTLTCHVRFDLHGGDYCLRASEASFIFFFLPLFCRETWETRRACEILLSLLLWSLLLLFSIIILMKWVLNLPDSSKYTALPTEIHLCYSHIASRVIFTFQEYAPLCRVLSPRGAL